MNAAPLPDQLEANIELYLRSELEPAALEAFELQLDTDPGLRAQVQAQRHVDRWLRQTYTPIPITLRTSASAPPPAHAPAPLPFRPPLPRRLWWYAVAAAILLSAAGLFVRYTSSLFPDPAITPDSLYNRLVMRGFQPTTVCTTDAEFAAFIRQRFGQALAAAPTPAVQLVGWGYGDQYDGSPLSPQALILLARVDGAPVVVLIDRASADRPLTANPAGPLHLFRRPIGRLITYELTPADHPSVIDTLSDPDGR